MRHLALLVAVQLAACTQLLDGDHEYRLVTGGAGGSSAASSGTTTSEVVKCKTGKTLCGQTCTDTDTDALNCGRCDRDCMGTACVSGFCEAQVLVPNLEYPMAVTVDDTHAYFGTQDGVVQRVPKGGGMPTLLTTEGGSPGNMVVYLGHLYWTNHKKFLVQRMAKNATGKPLALSPSQPNIGNLVVDDGGVYFLMPFDKLGEGEGKVGRVPLLGGDVTWISGPLVKPYGISLFEGNVYFTQTVYDGADPAGSTIDKVPSAGGGLLTNVVKDEILPRGIAVESGAVYWANDITREIRKKSLVTGETTTLATGQDIPYEVVLDDKYVYWTTTSAGTVMKVPKVGGPVEALAAGRVRPSNPALDEKYVYWVDFTAAPAGAVLRVPK